MFLLAICLHHPCAAAAERHGAGSSRRGEICVEWVRPLNSLAPRLWRHHPRPWRHHRCSPVRRLVAPDVSHSQRFIHTTKFEILEISLIYNPPKERCQIVFEFLCEHPPPNTFKSLFNTATLLKICINPWSFWCAGLKSNNDDLCH